MPSLLWHLASALGTSLHTICRGNNLYCTIAPSRHWKHPQRTATKATCRVFVSRATRGCSLACQGVSEPTNQSFQRVFIRNNRLWDNHTRYNQATNQRGQSADNHARIITRWHNHQQAVAFTRYQSVRVYHLHEFLWAFGGGGYRLCSTPPAPYTAPLLQKRAPSC